MRISLTILDFIIKEMNRSATVEKAYGAYTHHELSVLVTVLTRRQALQLRNTPASGGTAAPPEYSISFLERFVNSGVALPCL